MDRYEQEGKSQMAFVGMHPSDSTAAKPIALERADSAKEKIVAQPPSAAPEKDLYSPVSPITNYDLRPSEAPQVISSSPKFIAIDKKDPDGNAPIVAPPTYIENIDDHSPNSSRANELSTVGALASPQGDGDSSDQDAEKQPAERKKKAAMVCGLPAKLFYTFLAIGILIVIGAAVGGGVGGSIAARNKANKSAEARESAAAASASSAAVASASSAAATRTSSSDQAEQTRPTIVGYYLELYSGQNYTGALQNISRFGEFQINFEVPVIEGVNNGDPTTVSSVVIPRPTDGTKQDDVPRGKDAYAKSYVWVPGDTGACVRFCNDGEATGYRCQGETHQPFPSGAGQFNKVLIDFGGAPDEARCAD